jgi:hypothetical protein
MRLDLCRLEKAERDYAYVGRRWNPWEHREHETAAGAQSAHPANPDDSAGSVCARIAPGFRIGGTMLLENCSPSLQELGNRLFGLIEAQTGCQPELQGEWYRVTFDGGVPMYLKFVGGRAWKNRPNSAVLVAPWDASFANLGATLGNNWFGAKPSAELSVVPGDTGHVSVAEEFIKQAFS